MKKLKIILPILAILMTSCEEVIDLELNTAEPKLVIEASINYFSDPGVTSFPKIKLSLTAPFFDAEIPPVTNAEVTITDEAGTIFQIQHSENGWYIGDFEPQPNTNYTLEIIYDGEIYTSSTKLVTTPPYNGYVEQNTLSNLGETRTEIKVYFNDPEDETNFYFYVGKSRYGTIYDTFNDAFFNGNQMFNSYTSTNISPGNTVTFELYGITQVNYNYYFTLLLQTDNTAFGPFSTHPATVRGNVVNETNPDNFPLGYFRISEVATFTYTVQ